jgi:hypothetical protein
LSNWLYQLRSIWRQYLFACREQRPAGSEALRWFLSVYAPCYEAVSGPVARLDELEADSYAMELFNDELVREMISADCVYAWYLNQQYWPAVNKIVSLKSNTQLAPYSRLAEAVRRHFPDGDISGTLRAVLHHRTAWYEASASLEHRLENIGHATPATVIRNTMTAADVYLDKNKTGIVDLMDKLWMHDQLAERKKHKQVGG